MKISVLVALALVSCLLGSSSALTSLAPPKTSGFFLPSFLTNGKQRRQDLKDQILALSRETQRGLQITLSQQEEMQSLFAQLEQLNPTPKPLQSKLVNGVWNLEYTTSESILGKNNNSFLASKAAHPILQTIDTTRAFAENSEIVNYFGGLWQVPSKVTALLEPQSDQYTLVQFQTFFLGPLSFDAPAGKFQGALDITYVDDTLRLTRGDKGNIFVLTRT
mmetsp:Transcript_4102/g.8796  ORF Transcript_4102/g.8796 Transcript_4102/m.8796 type:complete len:220 (-) Transcript_4102:213-872(-)